MKLLYSILLSSLFLMLKAQTEDVETHGLFFDLNKYSDAAVKKLESTKEKEKYYVTITNKCSQADFEQFCKLGWITKISFTGPNSQITDLSPLSNLINLSELSIGAKISSKEKPLDISVLAKNKNIKNLKSLEIRANPLKNWEKLEMLSSLTKLKLSNTYVTSVGFLSKLTSLTEFSFEGNNQIIDLKPISACMKLETVSFDGNEFISHNLLESISALPLINSIDLDGCVAVYNFNFMKSMISIEKIDASEAAVISIDGLIGLSKIKSLDISKTLVKNINSLKGKLYLEELNIEDLEIKDLSPLYSCVSLGEVNLSSKITADQQKTLQDNLPKLEIKQAD